jgi:putative solute:sodium symporter small subunit|tara:strand:+ start:55 stop:342 length:288 start_codon:yes stop_codon:yes gene_type:complete
MSVKKGAEEKMSEKNNHAYWQANLRLMLVLLVIWFSVSFLAGIIFVDFLNQFRLYGYKLGFWFSQQGAIYFFVLLIFVYAWRMNVLDKKFGVSEE